MLVAMGGMMNMFRWSTKLLMQVGRSKMPFKGLSHPKVIRSTWMVKKWFLFSDIYV